MYRGKLTEVIVIKNDGNSAKLMAKDLKNPF